MTKLQDVHKPSTATWIALALTIIGALNWGLVGLFRFDLVAAIFGTMSAFTRFVYVVVGLAAVYLIAVAPRLGEGRRQPTATRREAPREGARTP